MDNENKKKLNPFEESLIYLMDSYRNGECDLDDILRAADKVECFKQNVSREVKRTEHNEREMAFHLQWIKENAPVSGINHGHGILQDLFIETGDTMFSRKTIEEISSRDRMIVATVIQWLGTNCGMAFLSEALARFGAKIEYKKKEVTNGSDIR